jgi:hypothetical protein
MINRELSIHVYIMPMNDLSCENNTVVENIIATTKIRNNYGAIQSFIFPYRNIGLFSIAHSKVITHNPLCILFGISSLLFFYGFLSKVIALPTIAIAIVVALSHSYRR